MTLDTTLVTKNTAIFSSTIIASIGWLILFIGACASRFTGVVWWIIIYELILVLGLLYVLMSATFADYRLLMMACLAISITLLTQTIDNQLHVGLGSAKASAAGGILMILMQFFWVMVFGSTPESWCHSAVYGPPSSTNYNHGDGNVPLSAPTNYSISNNESVHSHGAPMVHAVPYPAAQHQQQYQVYASSSPAMTTNDSGNNAIALHPYTANPDDPNEISFYKGEVLEILDRRGNWWQARKQDQTIGIVPSNYFTS
ncbi:unnamed protein product [Absidia cylindrospora]